MGKMLIQYAIPASILVMLAVWGLREWYLKYFPKTIDNHIKMEKAHQKYEKKLQTTKPKKKKK